jgi:hypothetical protein
MVMQRAIQGGPGRIPRALAGVLALCAVAAAWGPAASQP